MNKIDVIRLIFKQPTAHYRVGFTQQNLHRTLPLPPPSTIIGMIHNLMECENGGIIKGFDIAVCGHYESVFYQYQSFRKIFTKSKVKSAYKEAHPGVTMPNQVQMLNNVYLRIYLTFDDFDKDAPLFIEKIKNPSIPFFIGRREDLAVLENIEIMPDTLKKSEFPQRLKLNYWAAEQEVQKYRLNGPVYLLGTYYRIEDKIRNFERRRFYYIEPQPLHPIKIGNRYKDPEGWTDEDDIDGELKEIPVFFLGINRPLPTNRSKK